MNGEFAENEFAPDEVAPEITPSGVELIALERKRQVEEERWTPEHDDTHAKGELAAAAMAYLRVAEHQQRNQTHVAPNEALNLWPFSWRDFKPKDESIPNLVKAGSLIAAEIDRLQRK